MLDFVCGPLPLVAELGVFFRPGSEKEHYIAQESKAWPSHSNISYSFIGLNDEDVIRFAQEELVTQAITEYTRYANVNLVLAQTGEERSADIRISFDTTEGVWSAIGVDALKIPEDEATMNLGFFSRRPANDNERKEFYSLTLHQFGHAFGLAHEWDASWATLTREGQSAAIQQHKAAFGGSDTSNFPIVSATSIMKFFAPRRYITGGGRDIPLPDGLSRSDKAWLTLIYPGKASPVDGETDREGGILKSLIDLELPLEESSHILLCSTVSEMRFAYHRYISEKYEDKLGAQLIKDTIAGWGGNAPDLEPDSHVLQGKVTGTTPSVDHNNEDDLYDTIAAAVLDPQFHQVIANVVSNEAGKDAQRTIRPAFPPSTVSYGLPGSTSPDVQNFIGPLISILGPLLIDLIIPRGAASGISARPLPPDVQQGIFDVFTRMMKHPVFVNVVKGIATGVLEHHGADEVE